MDRAQAWLRARARVAPRLLVQAAPWVRGILNHNWAAVQALAEQIRPLPPPVWDYLLDHDGGFVAIVAGEGSDYRPGPQPLPAPARGPAGPRRSACNVAFVSIHDLAGASERPLHVIGHMIDHYLGCGGAVEGRWLSEGGGAVPSWQLAGARLPHLFALGYGVDEAARAGVRDYFAQSLAVYCRDRQRLNVADPQVEKWLRTTLWSDAFWRDAVVAESVRSKSHETSTD